MIHSGFFFVNNSHDRVKIKLGVSKSDRLYAMKAEVLARAGIPTYVDTACQLSPVVLEILPVAECLIGELMQLLRCSLS